MTIVDEQNDHVAEVSSDPNRRAAIEFGTVTSILRRGRVVGECHSWFLESEQSALNLSVMKNGDITCSIESFAPIDPLQ